MLFTILLPQQYHPYPGQGKLAVSQDLDVLCLVDHVFFFSIGAFSVSVEYYSESFSKSVSAILYFHFGYEVVGFFVCLFGGFFLIKV